jgi:hypothetical protein
LTLDLEPDERPLLGAPPDPPDDLWERVLSTTFEASPSESDAADLVPADPEPLDLAALDGDGPLEPPASEPEDPHGGHLEASAAPDEPPEDASHPDISHLGPEHHDDV